MTRHMKIQSRVTASRFKTSVNISVSLTTKDELWLLHACLPNAEQAIVCSARQEIETVAVGRSCGGKAQGRHSGGVACELLHRER